VPDQSVADHVLARLAYFALKVDFLGPLLGDPGVYQVQLAERLIPLQAASELVAAEVVEPPVETQVQFDQTLIFKQKLT